jgi:hypothetical protein
MEISRATRYEEFAPFIEEGKRARKAVEDFFDMSFEEAIQQYDVSDILPTESEALKRHYARLSDDLAYRDRCTKKQLVTAGAHGLTRSLKRHKKKYRREYETSCFNLF